MKRGTDMKFKFRELSLALGLREWETKGLLQSLWDFTGENAQRGDIGKHTDDQIAVGIGWERTTGSVLIETLIKTKWLDASRKHRVVVHEWHEHCEDWVKKRVARAGEVFATENSKSVSARKSAQKTADNGGQRRTTADSGGKRQTAADEIRPPIPIPIPIPIKKRLSTEAVSFDSFWKTYPKRVGRGAALKAWKRLNPDQATVDKILTAIEAQRSSPQWQREGGQYIPHPATWLNAERWHDEVAPKQIDPVQAMWDAPPKYYPCVNPDCPEPVDMRAHETKSCPYEGGLSAATH